MTCPDGLAVFPSATDKGLDLAPVPEEAEGSGESEELAA